MKADHFEQQKLLDLAAEDVALTQLAHRRATLPEVAAVETAQEAARTFSADVVRAETEASPPRGPRPPRERPSPGHLAKCGVRPRPPESPSVPDGGGADLVAEAGQLAVDRESAGAPQGLAVGLASVASVEEFVA